MKLIQLLLTETIDNLGIVGDVVKVRPGYARNYLLPRNMATKPTPGNIKSLAARRAQVEAELKAHRAELEAVFEKLKNHELTIMRSANEQGVLFGGVNQHDITEALRAEGFQIEDRMVRIGQQIKRLDSYHIPIVMANDLKTEIKLWVVSDKALTPEEGKAAIELQSHPPKAEKPEKVEKAEKAEKVEKSEKAEKSDEAAEPKAEKKAKKEPKAPRAKKKAEEAAE